MTAPGHERAFAGAPNQVGHRTVNLFDLADGSHPPDDDFLGMIGVRVRSFYSCLMPIDQKS